MRKSNNSAEEIAPDDDTENHECCLVRVLRIVVRDGSMGRYKTVKIKQEVRYWLRTFRLNLYTTVKEDMQQLQLEVKVYLAVNYIFRCNDSR